MPTGSAHGYWKRKTSSTAARSRHGSTRTATSCQRTPSSGTHQVELSAKLIVLLKKHNWTNARIGMELGMDADEVLRLKQITGLAEAFKDEEFSKSWEPVYDNEPIKEEL